MALVLFTSLDGSAQVAVESTAIKSLEPVRPELLPPAVLNGTRIALGGGVAAAAGAAGLIAGDVSYLDVQGTVANTIALIGSGGGAVGVRAFGFIDPTGALLSGFGIASVLHAGVGVYTITFSAPIPTAPPGPAFTFGLTSNGEICVDGPPAGANQDVNTFDSAGAPADLGFFVVLVGQVA